MYQTLAIAAGGALGAVFRYWASNGVYFLAGRGFPYGTLFVNVTGCLLIGFLSVWLLERGLAGPVLRGFLLIGVLGGFTTFSAFSMETVNLIESGQLARALANVLLSVVLCVGAAVAGVILGRQL